MHYLSENAFFYFAQKYAILYERGENLKELLSPAGNIECLKAAINNGADACYLGGKSFGARAFAGNFTNEELKEAVEYAHLYGVKIYITVKTIYIKSE